MGRGRDRGLGVAEIPGAVAFRWYLSTGRAEASGPPTRVCRCNHNRRRTCVRGRGYFFAVQARNVASSYKYNLIFAVDSNTVRCYTSPHEDLAVCGTIGG